MGETKPIDREERDLKRMGKRGLLSLLAAGSMLTALGCEAVGGVNVNKAVEDMIAVQSSEGTMSLAWEVKGKPSDDAEAARVLAALGNGSIVAEYVQEDPQTVSMEGKFDLPKGDIPFAVYMKDQVLVLDIEGTKKPFELDMAAFYGGGAEGMPFDSSMMAGEAGQEMMKGIASYFIQQLANPKEISVGTSTETIDGSAKTLTKLTATTNFGELVELTTDALERIAADEEGLKSLIASLYPILKPIVAETLGNDTLAKRMLDNEELMVELLYSQFAPMIQTAAENLKNTPAEQLPVSPDSGVTAELLLDGAKPAGFNLELQFEPPAGQEDGLDSFAIEYKSLWWNVNGNVKAKVYDGATAPFPMDVKPRQRLANVEPKSLLYDILKNDLKITRHSFEMYMGDNASVPNGISPYIKGAGTTMVPVRYVSEQLDATVDWNGAKQSITIKDQAAGIEIVMKIGDRKATVNGAAQTLPEAPELIEGATFVPIAFITKALGGKASWDGELGIVTIEKEF